MPNSSVIIPGSGLPYGEGLDIACLSRIFDNTTNSYKFLFFLSLLDILNRNFFKSDISILLEDILVDMLATSWYSHCFFKLSFGSQDQIAIELDRLNLSIGKQGLKGDFISKEQIRKKIKQQRLNDRLLDYVPYRINAPFFEEELRGKRDSIKNKAVVKLAEDNFDSRKPLFKYNSDNSIKVHPEWVEYFRINYAIIRGWASWEWLKYMQRCNPSVPAISNKLFPPNSRDSLGLQTKYWKSVLINAQLRCIYSGEVLNENDFSLDHFLPWSFVTHDLLWNLIPTTKSVNSSKSDNLPALDYLDSFVKLQHTGLLVSRQQLPIRTWTKLIESYISDLRVSEGDLLNIDRLRNSYEAIIIPQINLATSHGFTPNWKFTQQATDK